MTYHSNPFTLSQFLFLLFLTICFPSSCSLSFSPYSPTSSIFSFNPLVFPSLLIVSTAASSSSLPRLPSYPFPPAQLTALNNLYTSTNGSSWNWYADTAYWGIPWNFTVENPNPCLLKWQGIVCNSQCSSTSLCNIIELNLPGFHMNGILLNSLGNLTTLESLNFAGNFLYGSLPSTIMEINFFDFY